MVADPPAVVSRTGAPRPPGCRADRGRPRLGSIRRTPGADAVVGGDDRRADHDGRADDDRHGPRLDRHRSHTGRAWSRRLPHVVAGRGAQRVALGRWRQRSSSGPTTGPGSTVRALPRPRRPGHLPRRTGTVGVHRGAPARLATSRLPGTVGDRRGGRPPADRGGAIRVRLLRQRRQDGSRARLRSVLRGRAADGRPHRGHRPRGTAAWRRPAGHRRPRSGRGRRSRTRP